MTNHPTYLGLLDDIIANPADDTPRLILADWLDENGQEERAEFIRVQCRIALIEKDCYCGRCVKLRGGGGQHTNGPCAVDQERDQLPDGRSKAAMLRRWQNELLHASYPAYHHIWAGFPLNDSNLFTERNASYTFRRGFVSHITCPLAAWREHGPAIMRQHPVEVVTTEKKPIFQMPHRKYRWFQHLVGNICSWEIPPSMWSEKLSGPYTTDTDALAALSRALIQWARTVAPTPEPAVQ